uniref:CAP, adenylate cyclase-associated protein 1 (yeast) n=1 Tax=Gouania willdenowi TaxID=441366 RepID=A0A8C5D8N6_GOUWI
TAGEQGAQETLEREVLQRPVRSIDSPKRSFRRPQQGLKACKRRQEDPQKPRLEKSAHLGAQRTQTLSPPAPSPCDGAGRKCGMWKVENQEGAQDLVISNTELKQVKGKLNSITVDNCKKMGLVFKDVDIKVQVMGKVPTISINKTDGCHVYLSKDSLSCEIISAKSSEMNVLVPNPLPVPEQFKTVWDGQKLVTTSSEIAG